VPRRIIVTLKNKALGVNMNLKQLTSSMTLLSLVALNLSGCASTSDKVSAAYVSPLQFNSYDCSQLTAESQRIAARVSELGGQVDKAATNDKVIMGVALIVFWPALFALGNKQQEAEYARLKGEYDAIQRAAIEKKCAGAVPSAQKPAEQETVKPAEEKKS
jgi:hypothetical protein